MPRRSAVYHLSLLWWHVCHSNNKTRDRWIDETTKMTLHMQQWVVCSVGSIFMFGALRSIELLSSNGALYLSGDFLLLQSFVKLWLSLLRSLCWVSASVCNSFSDESAITDTSSVCRCVTLLECWASVWRSALPPALSIYSKVYTKTTTTAWANTSITFFMLWFVWWGLPCSSLLVLPITSSAGTGLLIMQHIIPHAPLSPGSFCVD